MKWKGSFVPRHCIGADLSKEVIDLYHPVQNTHTQISNNAGTIAKWLKQIPQDAIVIFEATSGCDDMLLQEVRKHNTPFVRVNPAHAWHFARSCNLPKTDRVDARMLSAFGMARQFDPQRANSRARERLKALVQRRRQLNDMILRENNRLKRFHDPDIKRDVQAIVTILERRLKKIETTIKNHIAAHEEFLHKSGILTSVPGVGPVTVCTLLADMPELGTVERRQISSLAGLAPRAFESGKFKGPRRLGAGRRHVRRVLYMAALSVITHKKHFQAFIDRMRQQGRPEKVIILAVARKLITLINTLIKKHTLFDKTKVQTT